MLKSPKFLLIVTTLIVLSPLIYFTYKFITTSMDFQTHCDYWTEKISESADKERFVACMERQANRFVTVTYKETKDLIQVFFSLATAILVASISIADKFIDLRMGDRKAVLATFICWILLLASLVFSGAALAFVAFPAAQLSVQPWFNPFKFAAISGQALLLSVTQFILGLIFLAFAAIRSHLAREVGSVGA